MTAPTGYNLIFSDDFNGTSIDTNNWNTTPVPWYPNARSYNSYLDGKGNLIIRIQPDSSSSNGYTFGMVNSIRSYQYGYFEIRAKIASGSNISSAFWTTGKGWCWPPEIDIFETGGYYPPNKIITTYHWGTDCSNSAPNQNQDIFSSIDFSQDYHLYSVEWTPTFIRWLVDDIEIFRLTSSQVTISAYAMQFIFNLGPGWISNNYPNQTAYMYIDYFRAYQLGTSLRVSLNINPSIINIGQQTTITATVTGGVPPYNYSWSGLPNGCTGGNTNKISCTPNSAGTFNILVSVTDSS